MGVDSLNGKTGCVPTRAPALLQSTGINGSWGFLLVVTVVLFFFSFLLMRLGWADMETASHLHKAWPGRVSRGHTELPSWQRQEVGCKKLPLFNPGWLFLFSLSVIHFGRKQKFKFKQSTKTWKGEHKRQPDAPASPIILCPTFFFSRDAKTSN